MFNEEAYLLAYPDVADAVKRGDFSSGKEHYTIYGQFEENRIGPFFGTTGNDTIIDNKFVQGTKLIAGVAFYRANELSATRVGEVDTLIGTTTTRDIFVLGYPSLTPLTSTSQQLYVGGGNTDYALIKNFEWLDDIIVLKGTPQDYNLQVVNGNTNISTASGDLVGIVQGVGGFLGITSGDPGIVPSPFQISGQFSVVSVL